MTVLFGSFVYNFLLNIMGTSHTGKYITVEVRPNLLKMKRKKEKTLNRITVASSPPPPSEFKFLW